MDFAHESGLQFILGCVFGIIFVLPTLYVIAKCYLKGKCCFKRKQLEYDTIDDSSLSIEIIDEKQDEDGQQQRQQQQTEEFITEKEGYYYSRKTSPGSVYTLLGSRSKSLQSLNFGSRISLFSSEPKRNKSPTKVDLAIGYSKETSALWLNIERVYLEDEHESETPSAMNYQYRIKANVSSKSKSKSISIPEDPTMPDENYTCRIISNFLDYSEISKNVFYFNNAKENLLFQQSLKIVLFRKEISTSGGVRKMKRPTKLGRVVIELKSLDINGNVLKITEQLRPRHRNFII